jgi:hypothetical protein
MRIALLAWAAACTPGEKGATAGAIRQTRDDSAEVMKWEQFTTPRT